jgi:hypothetical protein
MVLLPPPRFVTLMVALGKEVSVELCVHNEVLILIRNETRIELTS